MTAPTRPAPRQPRARYQRHARLWADQIRAATPERGERLLDAFVNHALDEWPVALCEIEQLSDWTHDGLIRAALAAAPPPNAVPDGDGEALTSRGGCTPSALLTLRTLQMVGKLALACEQALHLRDQKTAIAMLRLASREWTHFKGGLAIEAALEALGAIANDADPEA